MVGERAFLPIYRCIEQRRYDPHPVYRIPPPLYLRCVPAIQIQTDSQGPPPKIPAPHIQAWWHNRQIDRPHRLIPLSHHHNRHRPSGRSAQAGQPGPCPHYCLRLIEMLSFSGSALTCTGTAPGP